MSHDAISTLKVQTRKVASSEAGQASGSHDNENKASGSHDQLIDESQKLSIIIHGKPCISRDLQDRLNFLRLETTPISDEKNNTATPDGKQYPKPQIQYVPFVLTENKEFVKYYEPRVVAIGPIHHGKSKFEYAENMKRKLAASFIHDNGIDKANLCSNIMVELEKLKSCYVENVIKGHTDDELAWMFLVDGCAVLHFIHCVVHEREDRKTSKLDKFKIKNDQVAFVQQDLFLLENQLPYQLLHLLKSLIVQNTEKEKMEASIKKFISRKLMMDQPAQNTEKTNMKALIRKFISNLMKAQPAKNTPAECKKTPCHLLELLREELIRFTPQRTNQTTNQTPHTFRNVKELMASGIRLKASDKSSSLDISFNRSCCFLGTLTLPSLIVDDSTAPKFLNLIAYEMCPDFMNNFEVTSYICFMDSLIDHPDDVQELRKAHILTNVLGSDDEVAKLFNKIGTDLVASPELYATVKDDIEKHYKSRLITWIAQAYHSYFSSPWTFLAFLGALLALLFSAVQAYFSLPHTKKC